MKYLRRFKSESDYQEFISDGEEYIEPHVVTVEVDASKPTVHYKKRKIIPAIKLPVNLVLGENGDIGVGAYNAISKKLQGDYNASDTFIILTIEGVAKLNLYYPDEYNGIISFAGYEVTEMYDSAAWKSYSDASYYTIYPNGTVEVFFC